MSSAGVSAARPWYREPWPWLLMLPPALSILGGLTMVYLAAREPAVLVVADYARIETLTSERYARDRVAAELGMAAQFSLALLPDGRVRLLLVPDAPGPRWPEQVSVYLRHAGRAIHDRALVLTRHEGLFAAALSLAPGRYELEVLPPDGAWRLAGTLAGVPADLRLAAPGRTRD